MPPETASESVYAELEPHIATDKIEHWFDLSSSDDTVEPHQSVALIAARAQLERLVKQRDWLDRELAAMRVAHQGACEMVAQMHAAAVGEATAPIRGVVEDVQDLRARCLAAEEALSEKPAAMSLIGDLCTHKTCVEKGVYHMVGSCANCMRGPFLMQFRIGHRHCSLTCPVCGVCLVRVERPATDDETPTADETDV